MPNVLAPILAPILAPPVADPTTPAQGVGYPPANALMGVNIGGPEYAPWNGQALPSFATLRSLRLLGCGWVRIPLPWESLQPVLLGALDPTFAASVDAVLDYCNQLGMAAIPEVHNFGYLADQTRWTHVSGNVGYAGNGATAATGVNVLGDGTLTAAHLNDLVARVATRWGGHPAVNRGIGGIGIMNEPAPGIIGKNRVAGPNAPGAGVWFGSGTVATLAEGTNPLGSDYAPACKITAAGAFTGRTQNFTYTAVPWTLSFDAWCDSGTESFQMYNAGTSSNKTATTTPTNFTQTLTPSAGASFFGAVVSTAGHSINVANFQLEAAGSKTSFEPSPWYGFAQGACDAIAAVNSTVRIYICGYNFGSASKWKTDNYELHTLTGSNPKTFEAHNYLDAAQGVSGGGVYSGSYASYGINANQGVETVDDYLAHLASKGKQGFIGEVGIPNNADGASWRAAEATLLAAARAANVPVAMWFFPASATLQTSNNLNIGSGLVFNDPRLLQHLAA